MEEMYKGISALEYKDNELTNETVKQATEYAEKCRKNLESAMFDYLYDKDSQALSTWDKVKSIFHCPVDIEVYNDKGALIGSVIDGVVTYTDDIVIELDGDVKTVYYPENKKVTFKMTGTAEGTMDYVLERYEDGVALGRLNYYDIPLTEGITYTQEVLAGEVTTDCTAYPVVTKEGEKIYADEYLAASSSEGNVTISWSGEDGGAVSGRDWNGNTEEKYAKGDTVKLYAQPLEGYRFTGWYEEDVLVAYENLYQFTAVEDRQLKAGFEKIPVEATGYRIAIAESHQDILGGRLYEEEGDTLEMLMSMYEIASPEKAEKTLTYTATSLNEKGEVAGSIQKTSKYDGTFHYTIDGINLSTCATLLLKDSAGTVVAIGNPAIVQEKIETPKKDNEEEKNQKTETGNITSTGTEQKLLQENDIVMDTTTNITYKVTKADTQNGTVEYANPPKGVKGTLRIPETATIDGITYKVTSIAPKAFKNNKEIRKIIIGKNIVRIGKQAFYHCKNLKKITIRTTKLTAKTVGAKAFKGIHKKAVVKVPKKRLKRYKKILKKKGVTGKKQKIR